MGYRAYLNDEIFYNNDLAEYDSYKILSGTIRKAASTAGSFTFVLPCVNAVYDSIKVLTDYVRVYRDDRLVFFGRVYQITEQYLTRQKTVTCEGMLAVLNDTVLRPLEYHGNLRGMVTKLLTEHNSNVEDAKKVYLGTFGLYNRRCSRIFTAYETTMSRLNDLKKYYGGFFLVREEDGTTYLDWKLSYDTASNQVIRLSENLLDVVMSTTAKNIATRVIPVGAYDSKGSRMTIKSINDNVDYVQTADVDRYGLITKAISYQSEDNPSELYQNAWDYAYEQMESISSYTIRALDLYDAGYDVDAFDVGQRIRIDLNPEAFNGEEYDADVAVADIAVADVAVVDKGGYYEWLNVNSVSIDIVNPANGYLEIGSTINSYNQSMVDDSTRGNRNYEDVSQGKASVEAVTQAINSVNSRIDRISAQATARM